MTVDERIVGKPAVKKEVEDDYSFEEIEQQPKEVKGLKNCPVSELFKNNTVWEVIKSDIKKIKGDDGELHTPVNYMNGSQIAGIIGMTEEGKELRRNIEVSKQDKFIKGKFKVKYLYWNGMETEKVS